MARLDGKELIGLVVDWDDPLQLGRVRIGIPSIMGNKIEKDLLPWLSTFSNPNSDGPNSFDRPAQPGSVMQVFFPHGSGNVNGIVKGIMNGLRTPEAAIGVDLSQSIAWVKDAIHFKPQMNQRPNTQQVAELNETGAEKVVTKIIEQGGVLAMADRVGIPSNLAAPLLMPVYDGIQNVSTALNSAAASMSPAMAASIPGQLLNLRDVLAMASNKIPSEVTGAINTLSSVLTTSAPLSGTNFVSMGIRVGPSGISNLANALSSATSFAAIQQRLVNGINDISTLDLTSLVPLKIDVAEGISVTLSLDGSISVELSQAIQQIFSAFSGLLASVDSVTGPILGNSTIPNTLDRLPMVAQETLRSAISTLPGSIGGALAKSTEFFG